MLSGVYPVVAVLLEYLVELEQFGELTRALLRADAHGALLLVFPNLLFRYLDVTPKNRVRFFALHHERLLGCLSSLLPARLSGLHLDQ